MFVFYFGIMADLTPPVALACFAAAPIARESGFKISLEAIRIALPGFVVPFMAVYDPALMAQNTTGLSAPAFAVAVTYMCVKAAAAVFLWGAAASGFLRAPMRAWERIAAFIGALLLVVALPLTDQLGFVLGAIAVGAHVWRLRPAAVRPA